ncbi:MAG: hypothetical protein PHW63_03985, partial [Alphaproteobacteria bacterium]|nr:hypothetical protein [Alphaproteobacteria bacterium]
SPRWRYSSVFLCSGVSSVPINSLNHARLNNPLTPTLQVRGVYFTPGFVDSVWPTWMTPLYRIGQHAIGACSFWIAGPIIKRFSAINILAAGTGFSYTLMLIATGITNFFSPLLLMTTQASYALTKTADLTVQQENFSNEQRATMGSLISLGTAGVTAVAAVLTGWISDVTTPAFAMGFMIVARALIVQSTYWRIYRKHK